MQVTKRQESNYREKDRKRERDEAQVKAQRVKLGQRIGTYVREV